ncbi:MAG: YlzJ-like family protein [Halothermotrichaceae bacterium]
MINYSIYPASMIFQDWDDFEPEYEEINLNDGTTLMIERIDKKQVKIIQVINSDPQKYLTPALTPGSIIKTSLKI